MKISQRLRSGGALLALLLVTQCALPPREAWRQVQSKGLFTYLSEVQSGAIHTPYRPDQLGSGLYRNQRSIYDGRYAALGQPQRYNQRPSSNSVRQTPVSRSRSASSVVTSTSKPKPSASTSRTSDSPTVTRSPKPESPAGSPSPKPAPTVADGGAEKEQVEPTPAPKRESELPYGKVVTGRQGLVTSPYAGSSQLVDVTGMGPGQPVKCPYTGKLFRVPAGAQASQSTSE